MGGTWPAAAEQSGNDSKMSKTSTRMLRPGSGVGRLTCAIFSELLIRNAERLRGGLVFKAHRLLYHSTLGSRVIKKKKKKSGTREQVPGLWVNARRVGRYFKSGFTDQ